MGHVGTSVLFDPSTPDHTQATWFCPHSELLPLERLVVYCLESPYVGNIRWLRDGGLCNSVPTHRVAPSALGAQYPRHVSSFRSAGGTAPQIIQRVYAVYPAANKSRVCALQVNSGEAGRAVRQSSPACQNGSAVRAACTLAHGARYRASIPVLPGPWQLAGCAQR